MIAIRVDEAKPVSYWPEWGNQPLPDGEAMFSDDRSVQDPYMYKTWKGLQRRVGRMEYGKAIDSVNGQVISGGEICGALWMDPDYWIDQKPVRRYQEFINQVAGNPRH